MRFEPGSEPWPHETFTVLPALSEEQQAQLAAYLAYMAEVESRGLSVGSGSAPLPTSEDGGGAMGTGRSYHEAYESGQPIPADEIAEWKTDAREYIPRLFRTDPVQFAPMARFLKAALLIVEQLQSDLSQARADGEAGERERITAALLAVDPVEWALAGAHAGSDAAQIARRGGPS